MTTFQDRQKGFIGKFAMDEELRFKACVRRNKLLGLWAAEKLGLVSEEAARYADKLLLNDLGEPGQEDVFRLIRADFDAGAVQQSDHQIRRTMDELMARAVEELKQA